MWPTQTRDMCLLVHWRMLEDGRLIVASFSEPNDQGCPVLAANIRADLVFGGYILTPKANGVLCQYVVQSDLKGSIPGFVVDIVSQEQPLSVANIRKVLDEDAKKARAKPQTVFRTQYTYAGGPVVDVHTFLSLAL